MVARTKRGSGSRPRPENDAPAAAEAPAGRDALSRALDVALLALALGCLVALWREAAPAWLASDECFHAYLAEWIAAHASLPRTLPEFYSGLPYFYPPLLHLIGAAVVQLAGVHALRYLNVVLSGLLFLSLYAIPVPGLSRGARRCALLLCLASRSLALFAVRFYAETLATLLAAVVVLLLLRARTRPGFGNALLLGLAVGAALLAKQPAGVLPVLLALLAGIDLVRGRRDTARSMGIALAASLVVAIPYFVRNAMLFGGPSYPPIATPAQATLDAMNTRLFSLPAPMFYRNSLGFMGPLVPWLALLALGYRVVRGRFDLVTGLLAATFAFILLAPWVPRFQPRHLNPVTAIQAVLGSIVLVEALAKHPRLLLAVQALLLVWGVVFVVRLGGLRTGVDATPEDREMYRAIAAQVPPEALVLSRATYDTWYYARRPATWPIPWGETAGQLELFTTRDPGAFLAAMDREKVGWLVVPRSGTGPSFTGVNYPQSFVDCVATLVGNGRLAMRWRSDRMALVTRSQ